MIEKELSNVSIKVTNMMVYLDEIFEPNISKNKGTFEFIDLEG